MKTIKKTVNLMLRQQGASLVATIDYKIVRKYSLKANTMIEAELLLEVEAPE